MIRVNRADLLQALNTVAPGLSPRDIVEQSSCFVFKDGQVITFNDEIACRVKTPLNGKFTGAVVAEPLLKILSKLPEEEVEIEQNNGELLVYGKQRKTGIRMEAEITLPIDQAEQPDQESWKELHEDFLEAVGMVQECAGRDESQFALTCVHLHPKWVEACDNFQMSRYRVKTGVKQACLVRKDSLKHIVTLGMTKFSETDNWIHFTNGGGLVLSCRRYLENYPDLKAILQVEGTQTTLPKGIGEAAEKADIFSSENVDNNRVQVDLRPGKLRIKGTGSSGWYAEVKRSNYAGKELAFQISPKLLVEIAKRHTDCIISANRLKVEGDKWVYITTLEVVQNKKAPAAEEQE